MMKLVEVTLESEMDLVLSNQKFIRVADELKLSLSTRSTFASAISEVVRVLTDHTDSGVLQLGVKQNTGKQQLVAEIHYPSEEPKIDEALFQYAKRLVPVFSVVQNIQRTITFSIGLPKSKNLDVARLQQVAQRIANLGPLSTYEELKNTKNVLIKKTEHQKQELKASKHLNDLKSEFISMASHELKTPITILKAYGQLGISDRTKTVEQAQTIIEKMNVQCSKLSILALQLLDSAKIENGQLEYTIVSTELNTYLAQILEDLKHLVPGHTVITEFSGTCEVMIDRLRIEQVLSNLLSNAAKYSEENTCILMKTTYDTEKRSIILSITDQGIGISEHGLTRIFDKFHREPEVIGKQSGLGMGMYVASQIVRAHGGQIWVTSKQGTGSTFFISLPLN